MSEASAERQAFIRDLERREKQFMQEFKQTFKNTESEQLSELE